MERIAALSTILFCAVTSMANAQSPWHQPLGHVDWESVLRAEQALERIEVFIPPWYRGCSCYYSDNCQKTGRGTRCDYVGDCMGAKGCRCRPKPDKKINGEFICGSPEIPGQCDGVCRRRPPWVFWDNVVRVDLARFADLMFEAYLGAARRGGGYALIEPLQNASRVRINADWQIEIESAVNHVLMVVLGRDFLPPTAHAKDGGEPRGQVLRINEAGINLLDTVRAAFVGALAGERPPDAVDAAIKDFASSGATYEPHHGGRCYPHGHPEYKQATPCLIDEVRAALDDLLEGAPTATAP